MSKSAAWRRHAGHLAWPTLLLAAGIVGGEVLLWAACLSGAVPLWLGFFPATVLAYLAFTPMHDATHGAVGGSRRGWIDDAVGWVLSPTLLAPFTLLKTLHLRHHGATNHPERDPDLWVAGGSALSVLLRCLTILPHYYVTFFKRLAQGDVGARRALPRGLLGLAGLLALGCGLALAGLGAEMLALWIGPAFAASAMLAFLFDWVPHHPHAVQERYRDTRVLLVPGLSLVMMGQNYHLIHHLYPRVPFYRYAALFAEVEADLQAKGAPIVRWPAPHPEPQPAGRACAPQRT